MDQDFKIILEKDGIQFTRIKKNNYQITFIIQNSHIHLPSIIDFDLLKLLYDLNTDIYEKVIFEKINANEAVATLLMKHFFADLGLPQRYSHIHIEKQINKENIQFFSQTNFSEKPTNIPEEAVIVPLKNMNLLCEIMNTHKVNVHCSIIFNENHHVPPFIEKFVGQIINKIFNRLKQFIENYRIT
jgi:hypothetical protein